MNRSILLRRAVSTSTIILLISIFGAIVKHLYKKSPYKNEKEHPALTLAIGGPWIDLHPGMQHTMWADIVLKNQFETLVTMSTSGAITPLAAKSWKISKDFRTYTFQIDTDRKYSDGSYLCAVDFKNSWEASLRMQPKSANRGGQDIFGFLSGYKNFKTLDHLSGIRVLDSDELQIQFTKPYRMALSKLSGSRFAAFKNTDQGTTIGTGHYIVQELSKTELNLVPNPYFSKSNLGVSAEAILPLRVLVVPTKEANEAITDRRIDAVAYAHGGLLTPALLANKSIQVQPGPASIHDVSLLNSDIYSILNRKEMRWAFQFLLAKIARENPNQFGDKRLFSLDPQVYLPLQAGRLSDLDVDAHLKKGEQFLSEFRLKSKLQPLRLYFGPAKTWLPVALENEGITIAKISRQLSTEEAVQMAYHSSDFDALLVSFSVVTGDPDGIYHMLGRNGGILCPVAYREAVGELLEQGRELIHPEELDAFYKKVSHAILDEVPFVHFGFNHSAAVYSKDRVRVGNFDLQRSEGHFNIFRPK